MRKTKLKDALIPKFPNEAEEATWWDGHRSEVEAQIRKRIKQKRPLTLNNLLQGAKPSQPVTLRIPKEDLERARLLAARKGLGYQTYMKMLLRDALSNNMRENASIEAQRLSAECCDETRRVEMTRLSIPREIHFRSYNPYESLYPGLRVVSRETLHLIKTLRSQGCSVVVEPDDGTKLHYSVEKGFRELLCDPIYAFVIGLPTGLLLNLIANWISQLRRPPDPEEVNLILEFDEGGNRVRYSQNGRPISDYKFKSILSALETRKFRFEEARKAISPYPGFFIPVHLEHTGKVVGWSKGFIFNDQKRSIELDATKICDGETWKRIQSGELRGFSIAGIVSSAICSVCKGEYVDCNHIAGAHYDGKECIVRTTTIPAEVSIVRDPVQPLARIELRRN